MNKVRKAIKLCDTFLAFWKLKRARINRDIITE